MDSVGSVVCVAWRFWLGALNNKDGRGLQRNREEIVISNHLKGGGLSREEELILGGRGCFMASVLLKELEYKMEKVKYKKLEVMQPRQDQKQI